mgnify:CR=1 FL=1
MNIPNPNTENIYVFDNYENFAEAVERFARGVNVFWKHGTTYDMITRYENGALIGAKYTVDANGETATDTGGYNFIVAKYGSSAAQIVKGSYNMLLEAIETNLPIVGIYTSIDGDQIRVPLSYYYYYGSTGSIFAQGMYVYDDVPFTVSVEVATNNTVDVSTKQFAA